MYLSWYANQLALAHPFACYHPKIHVPIGIRMIDCPLFVLSTYLHILYLLTYCTFLKE